LVIVTIGVCVRNCENLLKGAIESISEQDFPSELAEAVFVDDGSTDGTLELIKSQIRRLKQRSEIIRQEWKGLGAARNAVVANSTGKYIIWVDGDMQLSSDFVRKQVDFMERNPRVAIAKGTYGMYQANLVSMLENIELATANSSYMRRLDPNPLGTGGSIYRVDAIKEVKGFDDSIKGSGEDAEIEHRIKAAGWLLDTTAAVFYEKRRSSWRSLWKEYFWHGKGGLVVIKGKTSTRTYKFLPPVALAIESLRIVEAYKLTRNKIVLLLPFHYAFKRTAWLAGSLSSLFQH
jgi:glycosyltransferase involved in cell wall biosynthesis